MSPERVESLPAVSILGIGAVTPLGRGLDAIAARLSEQIRPPAQVLRVDDELLSDPGLSRQLRRADRFTRMAAMAALDAWNASESNRAGVALERIGMIVSSGFGPHCRGFRFLDGILDCGDTAASPTDFSHSVHGAASAYISGLLGLRGPSLNVTDFEIGFEEVVRLAQCWLAGGACDRVLIGAVEELGDVMLGCAAKMLDDFPSFSPGEGAVFLMLGPGHVRSTERIDASTEPIAIDLLIVDEPPILQSVENAPAIRARRKASFSRSLGHSASGAAFELLGGILALRGRLGLTPAVGDASPWWGRHSCLSDSVSGDIPVPRTDSNPLDSRQARMPAPPNVAVDNAATFRTSSDARPATLMLTRGEA